MAWILSPAGETKLREMLRTEILFLAGMAMNLCRHSGCGRGSQCLRRSAPGEEPAFQHRQDPAEQECCESDGDDSGIDPFEIEVLASRFHHVSHTLARVHHLGKDDV